MLTSAIPDNGDGGDPVGGHWSSGWGPLGMVAEAVNSRLVVGL